MNDSFGKSGGLQRSLVFSPQNVSCSVFLSKSLLYNQGFSFLWVFTIFLIIFVTVWHSCLDNDILGFFISVDSIIWASSFLHTFVRVVRTGEILTNSTDSPEWAKEGVLNEGKEMNNFCFQWYLCPPFGLKSTWIQNATVSCIAYTFCFLVFCSIVSVNYLFDQGGRGGDYNIWWWQTIKLCKWNKCCLVGMPILSFLLRYRPLNKNRLHFYKCWGQSELQLNSRIKKST